MDAKFLLSLLTSCFTLTTMYFVGRKMWQGWVVGLCSQIVWGIFILTFKAWGLLPLSICLTVMYIFNLRKWRKSECLDTLS